MNIKQHTLFLLLIALLAISTTATAGEQSVSLYTPMTFATSAIRANGFFDNDEKTILRRGRSAAIFGIGANYGFQKNASVFMEKVAVGDSSKDIYLAGVKFNTKDALIVSAKRSDAADGESKSDGGFKMLGDFVKLSYILGAARITQDEKTTLTDTLGAKTVSYQRANGYNAAFGVELMAMKSSNIHFVPLRFVLTLGQSGTSALATTEVGLSLFGL